MTGKFLYYQQKNVRRTLEKIHDELEAIPTFLFLQHRKKKHQTTHDKSEISICMIHTVSIQSIYK